MAGSRLLGRRLAVGVAVALVLVMGLYACFPGMPLVAMPRRGMVVDRQTGKPVAGALVFLTYSTLGGGTLRRTEQLETRWTETDAEGRFRFGMKLFDDVGSRVTFSARTPELGVFHRDYYVGTVGFEPQAHRLPLVEVPVRLKPFESEEEIRKLRLDPRIYYRDPKHLVSLCSGLSQPACHHLCEWLHGLPEDECERLRRGM
jgi:hypothetical protein